MKRILVIAISALFVLGLSATAFAIHAEIPSETQAVVAKGTTQVTLGGSIRVRGETRQNTTDFDDDAADRKNAYDQRVRLSVGAQVADNLDGLIMLEAGNGPTADSWTWGTFNSHPGVVDILQAWINYNPGPVGVKVGHMPLALGNKLFFDHRKFGDDAIVVYADPAEGVHVAGLAIKFLEGNPLSADDLDGYVVLGTYTTDTLSLGGDITWLHDKTDPAGVANLYNLGVRAKINAGAANIKADLEIQSGSIEAGPVDIDFAGMAILLGADMKAGGNTIAVELGYGTGDEGKADEITEFVNFLSSGVPYVGFVYNTRVEGACGLQTGLCGTTYLKGSVTAPLTEAMKLKADVLYLLATEDVSLNGGAPSDDLGIEIDAKVTYSLARNLKYWVEGGYFLAGEAYEDAAGDADAAYALRHGIELSF